MSTAVQPAFHRISGALWCEGVKLSAIAEAVGTPAYVYSRQQLLSNYAAYAQAMRRELEADASASGVGGVGATQAAGRVAHGPPREIDLVCYAVKALSNLAVLRLLADAGSGFDVVSAGELARVLEAGGDPGRVVFSGAAKAEADLRAGLAAGIRCFNVEGEQELAQLSALARQLGKIAPIALRVNPHVDARTHPYVATALRESKFGVPIGQARRLYAAAAKLPGLRAVGISFHLGSQIEGLGPFREALAELRGLIEKLLADGHALVHVDVGGGLGIRYQKRAPPTPAALLREVRRGLRGLPLQLLVEPGRSIAASAGVLLTRVLGDKRGQARRFLLVDAGMNDLIRPALYGAFHAIEPVEPTRARPVLLDVVGPVCESGDFLGKRRKLPPLPPGGVLAVRDAGAYGFSMASTYNSRPRPPEVLVEGRGFRIIRARETLEDLWRGERV